MCGICGFNWDNKNLLRKMTISLKHRGPDDFGYFTDNKMSLGHRRLSIIDLSRKGKQPMYNEDGSVALVYNGEIYNFRELRNELENSGHVFRSNTDSEVVVHAYEEYGIDCVNSFNGMFVFAIWDSGKEQLFLVRDRLGIKPLYYYFDEDKFIFASEIKTILEDVHDIEINKKALNYYLAFRYNHLNETFFKGIKKLSPGSVLIYNEDKIRIKKFWELTKNEYKDYNKSKEDMTELIRSSVEKRLVADVPVGVFLSGGMDSNTIMSMVNSLGKRDVDTFSIGFGVDGHSDELDYARLTADIFNTNHHELVVDSKDIKILPDVVWHLDEPIADPTVVPTYLISRLARKHVKVVLSGEGGDEVFGGYERFYIMNAAHKFLKPFPGFIRNGVFARISGIIPTSFLDKIVNYTSLFGEKAQEKTESFIKSIPDIGEGYNHINNIFDDDERLGLLSSGYVYKSRIASDINEEYFVKNKMDTVSKMMLFESKTRLPEDLLMKVDKMTMAHSLEARVPLLDHKLVEYSFSLPSEWKIRGINTKHIMKDCMKDFMPRNIIRRKKMHFFVPINRWFEGELRDFAQQILSPERMREQGIFNPEQINRCFERLKNSPLYYGRQLWTLLIFQIWYAIFVDGKKRKLDSLF